MTSRRTCQVVRVEGQLSLYEVLAENISVKEFGGFSRSE